LRSSHDRWSESIARGVLTGALAEKRRRRAIERLRDHTFICGYGASGQQIGSEFRAAGAHYVVVDFHEEALAVARERNDTSSRATARTRTTSKPPAYHGHAGSLRRPIRMRNVYITLSARAVRPDLLVVARA